MQFSQKQMVLIGAGGFVVIVVIFLIFANLRSKGFIQSFTLKVWGVEDKQKLQPIITAYQQARPGGKIEYTQIDPKNYHDMVLNGLASGNGPDVLYLGNRELPKDKDKLAPLNPQDFPTLGLTKFRELFPMAPEQDFISSSSIYALPLYLDTLALIYNRDLFDQAGIVAPPTNWGGFQADVLKLRSIGQNGQITRAAAAIGGSERTVDSGVDLVHLLMLQNGTKMVSDNFLQANFASVDTTARTGASAFNFYLQFANAGSQYYTWNDGQPNSLDSFAAGKTAMIVNYQSSLPVIKNKSPFLNIGIAPAPQAAGATLAVNYPKYYGLAVSRQSQNQHWAWDFIIYLTTDTTNGRMYFDAMGHPPVLRTLIGGLMSDPTLGVFAQQALTARTWYEIDDQAIDGIFNNAIQSVLNGQVNSDIALRQAEDQVTQIMEAHNRQ